MYGAINDGASITMVSSVNSSAILSNYKIQTWIWFLGFPVPSFMNWVAIGKFDRLRFHEFHNPEKARGSLKLMTKFSKLAKNVSFYQKNICDRVLNSIWIKNWILNHFRFYKGILNSWKPNSQTKVHASLICWTLSSTFRPAPTAGNNKDQNKYLEIRIRKKTLKLFF